MLVARAARKSSPFILHREDVHRLISLLSPYLPNVVVQVTCLDGPTRTFENLAEFDSYQNANRSAINELRLSSSNGEDYYANFVFNDDDRSNVRIELSGDDRTGTAINGIYEDFISGIQPWYRRIATADWVGATLLSAIFVVGGMTASTMIKTHTFVNLDDFHAKHFIVGLPLGMLPLLIGIYLRKIKRRFFPMGAFAIGDGARRVQNDEIWRTVIIAGFVISILSGVVLSWFI
jgi:hypothetical protein